MSAPVGDQPPEIDRRTRLTRIALELAQIAALIAALLVARREGLSVTSYAALLLALVLTWIAIRPSRPPLSGEDPSKDKR